MRTIHIFPPSIFAGVTAAAFRRWFSAPVASEHEHWIVVRNGTEAGLPKAELRSPHVRELSDAQALLRLLLQPPGTRLVVHGLFGARLCLGLCLRPDLMRHATWMIWGGDIDPAPSHRRVSVALHDRAARSFGQVLSVMKEDHDKAVARFGATTHWRSVFYPGIIDEQLLAAVSQHSEPVRALRRVVVGNSASASNRHQLLLEQLGPAAPSGTSFHLPLSYGDASYRDQAIAAWRARFGDAVVPMVDFMSLPDYARFLASVDAGVYYFERQQGLGNILMLLALGKPVYLPEGSQVQRFLSERGFVVPGIANFVQALGRELSSELVEACAHNRALCLQQFSDQACRQAWSLALGIRAAAT